MAGYATPGFSFHDQVQAFKEIVDDYPWTFAQIQYNYMDEEYQAGTEGLNYAAEKGLGIVIMEPLRGGVLARETAETKKLWASGGHSRPAAEWGLRWLWNRPEITVVLSGMSTMQQVKDNLSYANGGKPLSLTKDDLAVYETVKTFYRSRMKIPCTKCRYCMPCMAGWRSRSALPLLMMRLSLAIRQRQSFPMMPSPVVAAMHHSARTAGCAKASVPSISRYGNTYKRFPHCSGTDLARSFPCASVTPVSTARLAARLPARSGLRPIPKSG